MAERGRFWMGWVALLCGGLVWGASEEVETRPRIQAEAVNESSGLDQSVRVPGRFWTHNDSGGEARLYAMDAEGATLGDPVWIEGARNVDWEALVVDGRGGLWIADTGNNANTRRDLKVYRVEEPGERLPESLDVTRTVRVRYPDQEAFPPEKMNFDCEAMFVFEGRLYFLTKHRSDRDTKLYRLDGSGGEDPEEQVLTLVERMEEIGQVTDADLHPDGRRLAVLTYGGVWVFERGDGDDRFLSGRRWRLSWGSWARKQTEGIAWVDGETLLICNEQRELFRVGWDELRLVE